MTIEQSVDILRELVSTSLAASAPVLVTAVIIGVVMSILQSVTSIQEPSLSFIPKVTGLGIVMVIGSPKRPASFKISAAMFFWRLLQVITTGGREGRLKC